MKWIALITLLLCAGIPARAQEEPSSPPPAAEPKAESASPGNETAGPQATRDTRGKQNVRIMIESVKGRLQKLDLEGQTVSVLVEEEGKEPALHVFAYGPQTRLLATDKKVRRMQDIPADAVLQVYFMPKKDESKPDEPMKARRIIVNPPERHAPAQPR